MKFLLLIITLFTPAVITLYDFKAKSIDGNPVDFTIYKGKKILIHGGGKAASNLSRQLGVEPQMINGRRITDPETLKIVTMVYAGWINKSVVAKLNSLSCQTLGLCGADLFLDRHQFPILA